MSAVVPTPDKTDNTVRAAAVVRCTNSFNIRALCRKQAKSPAAVAAVFFFFLFCFSNLFRPRATGHITETTTPQGYVILADSIMHDMIRAVSRRAATAVIKVHILCLEAREKNMQKEQHFLLQPFSKFLQFFFLLALFVLFIYSSNFCLYIIVN